RVRRKRHCIDEIGVSLEGGAWLSRGRALPGRGEGGNDGEQDEGAGPEWVEFHRELSLAPDDQVYLSGAGSPGGPVRPTFFQEFQGSAARIQPNSRWSRLRCIVRSRPPLHRAYPVFLATSPV